MDRMFGAMSLTLPISVTSTASTSTALPEVGGHIRVVNEGPNVAFISVGSGAQTATLPNATPTVTSTPVLAGEDIVLRIGGAELSGTALNISAICRTGHTATLDVQVGDGI